MWPGNPANRALRWYDGYLQHWNVENRMIRSVAVLLVVSASLFAAEPMDAVRDVAVGWTQAAVKQDETALQRLLADDLTYAHANGRTQNKAEYIAAIMKGPPRYESFDYSDMKIRLYGKIAVLTAFCDVKMVNVDTFRVRTLHVYVENNGQWQMAAHQSARVGR